MMTMLHGKPVEAMIFFELGDDAEEAKATLLRLFDPDTLTLTWLRLSEDRLSFLAMDSANIHRLEQALNLTHELSKEVSNDDPA